MQRKNVKITVNVSQLLCHGFENIILKIYCERIIEPIAIVDYGPTVDQLCYQLLGALNLN